jgi:hypothetical protein
MIALPRPSVGALHRISGVATAFLLAFTLTGCGDTGDDDGTRSLLSDTGPQSDVTADTTGPDTAPDTTADVGTDAPPEVHVVKFQGMGYGETSYTLRGSVSVDFVNPQSPGIEQGDSLSGREATGATGDPFDVDQFEVTGEIETLDYSGPIRVIVDGEIRHNGPKSRSKSAPSDGYTDKPPIKMTIHMSGELIDTNGRIGEKMVALYAARAFEQAGYGYEITYNLLAQQPPDQASNCSAGEAPQWWGNRVRFGEVKVLRKDANILMTNAGGGGCGAIGGLYGTTPGNNINEMREWHPIGTDDWQRNMHGTLHEIGHQLGARHDHEDDVDGQQHWGAGWNETDENGTTWWHRTPNTAGNGNPNFCDTYIEKRQTQPNVKRHQTYNECATARFDVKPVGSLD